MNRKRRLFLLFAFALLAGGALIAQRSQRGRQAEVGGDPRSYQNSNDTPVWKNAPGFEKDVFTFVRILYNTGGRGGFPHPYGRQRWRTDWPDADLNMAYRLQQMTSLKTDPNGVIVRLSDPQLFRYPFIYIAEPGDIALDDKEVDALRRYLLGGGFLMFDDFWGEHEWESMAEEMERVFPDRQWVDLPRTHPIFHCVFDIPNDLNLQCPNVVLGTNSQYNGVTWEREDAQEVHIRALFDDKGRMMCIATHNTDNGDGWEREGENEYYFREFSEKKSYPLGINIIFYVMTH